jgi:DNA polymerase-3 subunit epsilon
MLISRRVYPDAPNHRLETLVRYKGLKTDGVHHRALADAEMTAHLWISMINDIKSDYCRSEVPFWLLQQLAKTQRKKVRQLLGVHPATKHGF